MGYYEGQRANPCPRCGGVVKTLFISVSPMSFSQQCQTCWEIDFTPEEEEQLGRNVGGPFPEIQEHGEELTEIPSTDISYINAKVVEALNRLYEQVDMYPQPISKTAVFALIEDLKEEYDSTLLG